MVYGWSNIKSIIIQWGFITSVPYRSWTQYTLPISFSQFNASLIANGYSSDIRVARVGLNYISFFCEDNMTNVEWLAIGY